MLLNVVVLIAGFVVGLTVIIGILIAVILHRAPGQYLDVDGLKLYYRVEGEGVPVVLVHGYGANADLNWRLPGVIRALRQKYKVITFDVRGHGLTDRPHEPEKYGLEMGRDVIRLLDHLHIDKAHVVGYSMGGFITIGLLSLCPERLLSAVPCASGFEKPEGKNIQLLQSLTDALDQSESFEPLIRALEPVPPPAWKVKLIDFLMGSINDRKALSALMKGFTDLAISEEELRNNKVPVLSIAGTKDPLGAGIKSMTEMMPCHEAAYIKGGDHVTTILKRAYMQNLMAFLDKHSPEVQA